METYLDEIFLWAGFMLAFILGLVIVPKILLISYKKKLFDLPNSRKVHTTPVPRLGGLSFFPGHIDYPMSDIGARFLLGNAHSSLFP